MSRPITALKAASGPENTLTPLGIQLRTARGQRVGFHGAEFLARSDMAMFRDARRYVTTVNSDGYVTIEKRV